MSLWEFREKTILPLEPTVFADEGVLEQAHLQKVLARNISAIDPDLLVIAEEYSAWEDSRRRIDILALDREANLVVIELKRTEDGGHMDLQAIRYAAMVSTMTFAKAVEAFEHYLRRSGVDDDAEVKMLEFLEWDEPVEEEFANDVSIILASAEFSREITTAVLWLRTARQGSRDYTRYDLTLAGRSSRRLGVVVARCPCGHIGQPSALSGVADIAGLGGDGGAQAAHESFVAHARQRKLDRIGRVRERAMLGASQIDGHAAIAVHLSQSDV